MLAFVSYGPSSDTSVRMFDKTSILDWLSTPGWTSATRILDGVTGASANNMAATYNFEARIVLACGGQQASIGIWSSTGCGSKNGTALCQGFVMSFLIVPRTF